MENRNTIVRTERLTAGFGDRCLFRDLNLEVREGEFTLVRGENGSGKTTLIKIILGLIPAQSGRVFVMGRAVGSREWRTVRALVAYVPQHAVASDFPISALEVVEIGTASLALSRRQKRQTARDAMRLTSCLHLEHTPYAVLSGGEKQRISIARCLAQQARVLVLDEPASHLDRRTKTELMEMLARLNRSNGITVILVSHEHHDESTVTGPFSALTFSDGTITVGEELTP